MSPKLKQLQERHVELAKQIQEETQKAFSEAAQDLFAQYPEVQSFSWHQYTPYFNDGEECTFSVRCDYPKINGLEEGEKDEYGVTKPAPEEAYKAVRSLVNEMDEDIMKSIFGDHVEITIKRGENKATVEGYDHE